jgi:hypothetical protein
MDCLNYITLTGFVERMPSVNFEVERGTLAVLVRQVTVLVSATVVAE